MKMYAVFSWDSERGPIKSWDRLASVEIHNARRQPIAHGVHGAPPVEFLVGSPAIVADLRNRLKDHGIDPASIRDGGVIAYEAIITASPEFFAAGSAADQRKRLAGWTAAQVDFVTNRYGDHRVVSMVLHQDEQTPHIHAVRARSTGGRMLMRKLLFAAVSVGLMATATPSMAAPCKDAKGKFTKCPPKVPAKATRCKAANGKFAKCGTPGAKPI